MKTFAILFLIGICLIQCLVQLPNIFVCALIIIILSFALLLPKPYRIVSQYLLAVLFGFMWVLLHAAAILNLSLPSQWQQNSLRTVGIIATVPEQKNHALHFIYAATQISYQHYSTLHPLRILVTWYGHPHEHVRVGDKWELHLKLTLPHNYANPGTFDYTQWLLEQNIRATGSVINTENNLLLRVQPYYHPVDRFRQFINERIESHLTALPVSGMISALSVGIRNQISEQQWDILRGTGTNHLMAIAGLHIGFIAGITYWIANNLWRRLGNLPLLLPAQQFAAFASLLMAIGYSALAGFALPTQRAIIMLSVFLLATIIRRNLSSWTSWCLALLLILLWDPLATLSSSFWMSFGTVALIIYTQAGRLHNKLHWWHWFIIQYVISIGIIPFSLLFYQQISLLSIVANSIAIPWVGFLILPLSFLGSLVIVFSIKYGVIILSFAEHLLNILWHILSMIAAIPGAQWYHAINNSWIFSSILIGILLILAPQGLPARWLSIICALPLFFDKTISHTTDQTQLAILDTGPAMTIIVKTQDHALIYQAHTNTKTSNKIADAVLGPYLLTQGIKQIDLMVSDSTQTPPKLPGINIIQQRTSQSKNNQWTWNKTNFQLNCISGVKNKLNCELQIQTGNNNFTILNDMTYFQINNSHGQHSNTWIIIPYPTTANKDKIVSIINTQPKALIIANYKSKQNTKTNSELTSQKTPVYTTQNCGAIQLDFSSEDNKINLDCYKKSHKHFWN